ncbi:MAG TPA: hypothetical protein VHZ96_26520 [Frankiaceae bacterium]|jgi:hypothetical protein|nr:hypothetical protein [Frankiaceae bacterium]
MPHINLATYLADDTVDLDGIPSKAHPEGASYKIPSLSGEDGLLLQVITNGSDEDGNITKAEAAEAMVKFCRDADGNAVSLQRKLFGDALDLMVADGVSNNNIHATMSIVMAQASFGTEVARKVVARASGEAPARENRATRRSAAKKSSSSSRKAGSKSGPASTAKSIPAARASTPGRAASSKPQTKAV